MWGCLKNGNRKISTGLNDFVEIKSRGGLAQDTTIKKTVETLTYLIQRIYKIGLEDGMSKEEIKSVLNKVCIEPAEQKFETETIYEEISAMTYGTKRDEHGRITEDQITADLPHDQEVASQLLYQI
jgi:hypothetical protein